MEGGDDGDKSVIGRDTGFEESWQHREQRVQEHDGNAGVADRFMDLYRSAHLEVFDDHCVGPRIEKHSDHEEKTQNRNDGKRFFQQ